jgi:hypothetical protein
MDDEEGIDSGDDGEDGQMDGGMIPGFDEEEVEFSDDDDEGNT